MADGVRIVGLEGIPEIRPGDDLVAHCASAIHRMSLDVQDGDVVVVTQKIVSKAEGRIVRLDDVVPGERAAAWAAEWEKDARVIELVLQDAVRIVRMARGIIITETARGFICANSGVDTSNVPAGNAVRLPEDPDASARRLCEGLRATLARCVGVIISDTFGRPWRQGQTDVAIGAAGLLPLADYRGRVDAQGQPLRSTLIAVADELAAAAELVMGKSRNVPIAVVQGTGLGNAEVDAGRACDLLRPAEEDLFR